ncbi:MAG: twin-arginine translocase subunit TatC [Spirochaetes bacterium]|nr:twin-arginine translocase subunit TatC [Spirochaetota bacterium]
MVGKNIKETKSIKKQTDNTKKTTKAAVKKTAPDNSKKTGVKTSKKQKQFKQKTINNKKEKEIATINETDPDALLRGDVPMSIVGHLNELRSRLIVSLATIVVVMLASFFLSEYILNFLNRPYLETGLKLNVFNLTEGFILRVKASLITGIIIALPVIVYEIWKYILPAVETRDRKFIKLSVIAAVFLLYSGIFFTFFFILPFAIKMLMSFTPADMTSTVGASKYLSFVLLFCLAMGVMFELPIIIMILTRIGLITPQLLISKRKYALVLIWIVAAIITPPDVLTQTMLAIPVMLLYEISIIISKIIIKRKAKKIYEVG